MKISDEDAADIDAMVVDLSEMQKRLDAIRAKQPTTTDMGPRRLALAVAIVNLERAESNLREIPR